MIGKTLGHYEISELLGQGGMGEVYRATDSRLQRSVAVKILPPHLSEDRELLERFQRESRVLAELSHPHVCTLHDIGEAEGIHFLVMELLEGKSLAEELRRGRLSTERVLQIGIELCDALEHAHRAGVVHRDLKPGNVMLTSSGAKLLDFGLARPDAPVSGEAAAEQPTAAMPLTTEGSILGTLDYMSPEQVKGQPSDARSDIFSLGSVLYEMLSGRRVFEGQSQAETIASILTAEPPPVTGASPAFMRAIGRCLQKDREQRWQSARDLQLELEWIAAGEFTEESTASAPRRLPTAAWLLLLLLAASLGYFATRNTGPASSSRTPVELSLSLPADASILSIEVSPDGQRFVMNGTIRGERGLWLRELSSSELRLLPETEGAHGQFWSPDGQRIGFFQDGKLKSIGLSGAPPRVLCDAPGIFTRGSWGSRGVILFNIFEAPGQEGIYRVDEDGGPATRLRFTDVSGTAIANSAWPSFLPDGERFLLLAEPTQPIDAPVFPILAGRLGSDRLEQLVDAPADAYYFRYINSGHLLYTRNLTLFAHRLDPEELRFEGEPVPVAEQLRALGPLGLSSFSASDNGVLVYETESGKSQLQWKDRNGRTSKLVGEPGFHVDMRLGPRARQLAVARRESTAAPAVLWLLDLERDVAARLTAHDEEHIGLLWSPQGDQILYSSPVNAPPFMHRRSIAGGEAEVLLPSTGTLQGAQSFAANGRELVYAERHPETGFDLWILPLEGEQTPEPLLRTPADEWFASVSPDGNWIAYSSDESGRNEVYVQPYRRAGAKQRISTSGGTETHWSRDGSELFYLGSEGMITAVPIEIRDGRLVAGTPEPLFAIEEGLLELNSFAVSPDGQRFLVASALAEQHAGPTVVLDWTRLLSTAE